MGQEKKSGLFRPRTLKHFRTKRPEFTLGGELMAGVTVGLIALPLALALGIASVPAGAETPLPAPALGIFTAIIGGFLIALLGGSRVQIGGPTAAFIPIILLIVSEHGYSGLLLATGMNSLESIVERMRHRRSTVVLSGIHPQPLRMLRKAGFTEVVGRENICATFDEALVRAKEVLASERGG